MVTIVVTVIIIVVTAITTITIGNTQVILTDPQNALAPRLRLFCVGRSNFAGVTMSCDIGGHTSICVHRACSYRRWKELEPMVSIPWMERSLLSMRFS